MLRSSDLISRPVTLPRSEAAHAPSSVAPRRDTTARTASKGFYAVADQVVFGATNFVTAIMVARGAGKYELGIFALGLSFALVGLDLINSLVIIPYTVHFPHCRDGDARARFAGSAAIHTLTLGACAACCFLLLAALAPLGVRPLGSGAACMVLALTVPALFMRQHARMVCFAHLEFFRAIAIDVTVAVVQLGALGILLGRGGLGSAPIAWAVTAGACLAGVLLWASMAKSSLDPRPAAAIADFRSHWHFSKWLVATSPVAIVRSQLPLWLLQAAGGAVLTGAYSACGNITMLANPFLTGVNNFIGSKAAHVQAGQGKHAMRRFIVLSTAAIGCVMTGFLIFILVFGERLVGILFKDGFENLGAPISILAAATLAGSLSGPAYRGLLALRHSRITLTNEFLMFVCQITLGAWLVMRFGLIGAALAVLACNILGAIYQGGMFLLRSRRDA